MSVQKLAQNHSPVITNPMVATVYSSVTHPSEAFFTVLM